MPISSACHRTTIALMANSEVAFFWAENNTWYAVTIRFIYKQNMSPAPKYNPQYTVDDYQLWEGDWELWNGVAVAMTPSPFGRHGTLLARITTALSNAIDVANCDSSVIVEVDWLVSPDTVLRPDLTVVCGNAPARQVEKTPALVVEVLSDGTRERDLTFKKELYRRESVPWYLILDPAVSTLEALRLDTDGQYVPGEFATSLEIDICDTCPLSVNIERLFR